MYLKDCGVERIQQMGQKRYMRKDDGRREDIHDWLVLVCELELHRDIIESLFLHLIRKRTEFRTVRAQDSA